MYFLLFLVLSVNQCHLLEILQNNLKNMKTCHYSYYNNEDDCSTCEIFKRVKSKEKIYRGVIQVKKF